MTYERFLKIGTTIQEQDNTISDLYKKKIDLLDFVDPYQIIIADLLKEIYGDEGYDWFSWFCYESDYGKKWGDKGAEDENGNPICYSWKSLYEYLETTYRTK